MQQNKKQMKNYLKDMADHQYQPTFGETALYDMVKTSVCKRVQTVVQDIGKIIQFAIDETNFTEFDDLLQI